MPHSSNRSLAAAVVAPAAVAAPVRAIAQSGDFAEMRAQVLELARHCRADQQRLCASVHPGGGRILACLQAHVDQLAPECRAIMPAAEALKDRAAKERLLPK
jgi:hypothetical protein